MRVLVACEFSGIVRDAFRSQGHDAVSLDLLPSERPDGPHIQADLREALTWHGFIATFDLMIAHPPCTHLAVSGARGERRDNLSIGRHLLFSQLLLGRYSTPLKTFLHVRRTFFS